MKKIKWIPFVISAFLLSVVVSFNACLDESRKPAEVSKSSSTSTGNPLVSISKKVSTAVCDSVRRCHPNASVNDCEKFLLNLNGFGISLGLRTEFSSLSSIQRGEEQGLLVANNLANPHCLARLDQLDCGSELMVQAFLPSSANPYAGAVHLVSGLSCQSLLQMTGRYKCSRQVFLRNTKNRTNSPEIETPGFTFSVSPSLPDGLMLNPRTGVISGSPSVITPMTEYKITAQSAEAVSTSTVHIRTDDGFLVNDLTDSGRSKTSAPGTCRTDQGTCTLRAAIETVAGSQKAPVILLPVGTIHVASPLILSKPMDIYGDCESSIHSVVDGDQRTAVFYANNPQGPVSLNGLSVQNGTSKDSGGAGLNAEAMSGDIELSLQDVVFASNNYTGSAFGGGALRTYGFTGKVKIFIKGSIFKNNSSSTRGGAIDLNSGSSVTIQESKFEDNKSLAAGGAISISGGTNEITESLFLKNRSTEVGGAIYCSSGGGSVRIVNNTFFANTSARGSALAGGNSGFAYVVNSTFAGNRTSIQGGGAISTMNGGTIQIANSIVAQNTDALGLRNCEVAAPFVSLGGNLTDGADCPFTQSTDFRNTNAGLGPLAIYGGRTETLNVLPNSRALKSARNIHCPLTDQRRSPRTSGICDIGAFEVQ